jgi:DNA ligase 1
VIDESQMTLARDWTGEDLAGWFWSEKLNGCRVFWDGTVFWTRNGNSVDAPKWFIKGLPQMHLDGELHAGCAGRFGSLSFLVASNAVRLGGKWFNEPGLMFTAFDAPQAAGGWQQRMAEVKRAVRGCPCASAIPFRKCPDTGNAFADGRDMGLLLVEMAAKNSEGIMFREPQAGYEVGRSKNLLRFKFSN